MVDGEAEGQQVAQVCVLAGLRLCLQDLPAGLALLSQAHSFSQQDIVGHAPHPHKLTPYKRNMSMCRDGVIQKTRQMAQLLTPELCQGKGS